MVCQAIRDETLILSVRASCLSDEGAFSHSITVVKEIVGI